MSTPTITDAETDALAARAAGADREALAELYVAHQGTVLDLVAGHLRGASRIHIEDAAQDVWVEVCEWIGAVEPDGFLDWLAMLADEVAERYCPRPAPRQTAMKPSLRNPLASPQRIARLRWAVVA
jgi:DNA-directed RNA polymerase specialized sigma24 family protein